MWCMNCDRIRAESQTIAENYHRATRELESAQREIAELKRKVESLGSLLDESNRLVDGMCENKKGGSHV